MDSAFVTVYILGPYLPCILTKSNRLNEDTYDVEFMIIKLKILYLAYVGVFGVWCI